MICTKTLVWTLILAAVRGVYKYRALSCCGPVDERLAHMADNAAKTAERLGKNADAARKCRARVKAEQHGKEQRLVAAAELNRELMHENSKLRELLSKLEKPRGFHEALHRETDEGRRNREVAECDAYLL